MLKHKIKYSDSLLFIIEKFTKMKSSMNNTFGWEFMDEFKLIDEIDKKFYEIARMQLMKNNFVFTIEKTENQVWWIEHQNKLFLNINPSQTCLDILATVVSSSIHPKLNHNVSIDLNCQNLNPILHHDVKNKPMFLFHCYDAIMKEHHEISTVSADLYICSHEKQYTLLTTSIQNRAFINKSWH
jgi:hypothetical protein